MQPLSELFRDIFNYGQHALHTWLVRLSFGSIFLGLVTLILNIQNGLDWWFVVIGFGLMVIAFLRWLAVQKPLWNWVAITFFGMSAVLGVCIYLVLIGVLLPVPTVEVAAVAQMASEPNASVAITLTPTLAAPSNSGVPTLPIQTATAVPTKKTTHSSAQQTHTPVPTPTEEIVGEIVLEETAIPTATLLVIIAPTSSPTPEVVLERYLHIVQPDENLTCIATNYLGEDRYVPKICQFNQEFGLIGEDCEEALAPGRRILIPAPIVPGYESLPPMSLPPHTPNACSSDEAAP